MIRNGLVGVGQWGGKWGTHLAVSFGESRRIVLKSREAPNGPLVSPRFRSRQTLMPERTDGAMPAVRIRCHFSVGRQTGQKVEDGELGSRLGVAFFPPEKKTPSFTSEQSTDNCECELHYLIILTQATGIQTQLERRLVGVSKTSKWRTWAAALDIPFTFGVAYQKWFGSVCSRSGRTGPLK